MRLNNKLQYAIGLSKLADRFNKIYYDDVSHIGTNMIRPSERLVENALANGKVITTLMDSMRHLDAFFSNKDIESDEGKSPFDDYTEFGFDLGFLIENYLLLIEQVLGILVSTPSVEVAGFMSFKKIFDLADEVDSAVRNSDVSYVMNKNLSDLTKKTIEIRHEFNADIISIPIKKINYENQMRIDAELDKVRASQEDKINEISHQYSEGRTKLMESVDKYKNSVGDLVNIINDKIRVFDEKIKNMDAEIDGKNIEIDRVMVAAESCLDIANGMLQRTSQVGMAAAFQERHKNLKTSMVVWFIAFFTCLSSLTIIGVFFVISAFSSEIKTVVEFLSRIAITFPLVWGAWFSAKQYSHVSQLREDYAYKVAVAMTYHGYKSEAADVNNEMSGKLLDSIISQFSDNPVRLYQNDNSSSVIEAILKNDKLSDIINSAKNGVSGSAK